MSVELCDGHAFGCHYVGLRPPETPMDPNMKLNPGDGDCLEDSIV